MSTEEEPQQLIGEADAAFVAVIDGKPAPSTISSHPGKVEAKLKKAGISKAEIWKCRIKRKRVSGITRP